MMYAFTVSLYPAIERETEIQIEFGAAIVPRRHFQAATTNESIAFARRFAAEHGQPCFVALRNRNGQQNPPDFDAACETLRYANLPSQSAAVGHASGDHAACSPYDCRTAEHKAISAFLSAPRAPGEEDNRDYLRAIFAEEGLHELAAIRP